jgi:hypothetical protein
VPLSLSDASNADLCSAACTTNMCELICDRDSRAHGMAMPAEWSRQHLMLGLNT